MGIPIANAASLTGGAYMGGMTFVLSVQILYNYGVQFNLLHDKKRQTILNLFCFIASINALFAYPLNQTEQSIFLSNVTTIISFLCVQYGLVIINHNSIARANAIVADRQISTKWLDKLCLFLYVLPFVTLIPIILASIQEFPRNGKLNTTYYNRNIYKPLTLALMACTELFALLTDILLIKKVLGIKNELVQGSSLSQVADNKIINSQAKGLITNYTVTWALLAIDIIVKLLIIQGQPLLFDSIISMAVVAMRARCNLEYGLYMREILYPKKPGFSMDSIQWSLDTKGQA